MTYSIGFKSPERQELAAEVLHRLAEFIEDNLESCASVSKQHRYRDPAQPATNSPALVPDALIRFARDAVDHVLKDPLAIACAFGEIMTTPKPGIWFEQAQERTQIAPQTDILLDPKTRMMYDTDHIFVNGESYRAKGGDAALMQHLADYRSLSKAQLAKASVAARALLAEWKSAGWLHLKKAA